MRADMPAGHLDEVEFSFEFFPPRTDTMRERLEQTVRRLDPLCASFVSVTYGAGGTAQAATVDALKDISRCSATPVAAHLTCAGASRDQVDSVARGYLRTGIRHVVALRGDSPPGEPWRPAADGYAYASDLVAGLRRIGDFEISVAGYPEVHPEARNATTDLDNLKRKIDAGATRVLTQFCFDTDAFLRYLDRARAAGIDAPIAAGILPISNFGRTVEFARRCGASIPQWLSTTFDRLGDDAEMHKLVAASVAVEQCRHLQSAGINHFHFYTLNRYQLTSAICHMLRTPASGSTTTKLQLPANAL